MQSPGFMNQNLEWRKSSLSVNNGECVEVAALESRVVVRDSNRPGGPVVSYGKGTWSVFLEALKRD